MSETMTPTQQLVAAAAQTFEFKDALGRTLKMRPPGVLATTRLLRAAGAGQSSNEGYLNFIQVAASIVEIDGVPMPFPTSEVQIDAMVDRVGDEGYAAVMACLSKRGADMKAAAAAAVADPEAAANAPLASSGS